MQIKILKLLTCAALAMVFAAATAFAQSAGSWTMKAPVPARLNEVAVAAVGGKIHVIGGSVLGFTGPYHLESLRDLFPAPWGVMYSGERVHSQEPQCYGVVVPHGVSSEVPARSV